MMNKIMTLVWVIIMCASFMFFAYGAINLDTYYINRGLVGMLFSTLIIMILYKKHGAGNTLGIFIGIPLLIWSLSSFFSYLHENDALNMLIFLGYITLNIFTLSGFRMENE